MRCSNCHQSEFEATLSCPTCEFSGAFASFERLSNLNFLISELETWPNVSDLASQRTDYERQRREVEVELGLRLPPPTVEQAGQLRQELSQLNFLHQELLDWVRKDWILPVASQSMLDDEIKPRLKEIEERLLDAPPPLSRSYQALLVSEIEQKRFFLKTVEGLYERGDMVEAGYDVLVARLRSEIETSEIKAGLRQVPAPEPAPPIADSPPPPIADSPSPPIADSPPHPLASHGIAFGRRCSLSAHCERCCFWASH